MDRREVMSSRVDEEEVARTLTTQIIQSLEARYDKRIQSLEHIVLRQEEQIAEAKRRLKSVGRLEQQANSIEDGLYSLNRKMAVKQTFLERLGTEQGLIWQACDKNYEALSQENRAQGSAISNLQRVIEKQPPASHMQSAWMNETQCTALIKDENNRLVSSWEKKFGDLASFVHSTADCQTSQIAELQAKTLKLMETQGDESSDRDKHPLESLSAQLLDHSVEIRKLKEEQEVTLTVFVETMANMKLKFEGMIDDEIASIDTKANCTTDKTMKKVRAEVHALSKKTKAISEECEEIKDILEDSVRILAERTQSVADHCEKRSSKMASKLKNFASIQQHKELESEMKQSFLVVNEKMAEHEQSAQEVEHRFRDSLLALDPQYSSMVDVRADILSSEMITPIVANTSSADRSSCENVWKFSSMGKKHRNDIIIDLTNHGVAAE